MKKIFNTLVGLIIVIAVLVAGGALYLQKFLKDQADFQISMLIDAGFDQSSYGDIEIDFAKQNIILSDLKIGSSQAGQISIDIKQIALNKLNPLSMQHLSANDLQLNQVNFVQNDASYTLSKLQIDKVSYIYPSADQAQPVFTNMREIVQFTHQLIDYDQITLLDFMHKDFKDDVSKFDKASFKKAAVLNFLPNDINLHLEGVKIAPHHLDLQTAQMLAAYNIQSLEGIIDLSFNYDQANKSGKFSINNLYLGGLASLNGDTEFIMNDERFARFYEINNFQNFIKTIPFNQAKLDYEDLGLYQYFIDNQARLSGMQAADLKSQLYFGIVILAGQIQDLEMQKKLSDPLFKFHENPNQLKLLIQPEKPIRFEQYLNLYDLNGLTKDLNPSIQYL